MPASKELQFAAIALLQSFVNTYEQKMQQNPGHPGATYELKYDVSMTAPDWAFFINIGTKLASEKTLLDDFDMLIDLSDEKLSKFENSGKHVCQVMQIMAGVECLPLIELARKKPRTDIFVWGILSTDLLAMVPEGCLVQEIEASKLVTIGDHELTGVIGHASWLTYLAANYGLAVIEILPQGRPRSWMSKFANAAYRVVEHSSDTVKLKKWIATGIGSVNNMLLDQLKKNKQKEAKKCTAHPVHNIG